MITKKYVLETELVASDDGSQTFEIKREWDKKGKKALVIELYPTISAERLGEMDLSTMHLMNHVKELEWGCVRIINMYATVYDSKPVIHKY